MQQKSETLSRFKIFRDDICAFKCKCCVYPLASASGTTSSWCGQTTMGHLQIPFLRTTPAPAVCVQTRPQRIILHHLDLAIRSIRKMTRAYLFTSSLSKVWWYAATKLAIYVTNRLLRPPPKSPIETHSGKPWDTSRLRPFWCMCHYHVPKLMRGSSAALKPTSTAGIFVGYSLMPHKYIVFVYSTGAIVERTRVYFNLDVFPDDSGGARLCRPIRYRCILQTQEALHVSMTTNHPQVLRTAYIPWV